MHAIQEAIYSPLTSNITTLRLTVQCPEANFLLKPVWFTLCIAEVTAREFQFMLILPPPLDKDGSDASASKIFASHLFCKQVKEKLEDGSWWVSVFMSD